MSEWKQLVEKVTNLKNTLEVAIVGKYVSLQDAYLSVVEALNHAGYDFDTEIKINWIDSEKVTKDNVHELLKNVKGIVVPGGFGDRGIDGKIEAIRYARENKIPYLGICLGMHLAAVEFARNVLKLEGAHSTEIDKNTPHPIIDLLADQENVENKGGTLRLGVYPCKLKKGTKAYEAYQTEEIFERHRHRYEFNNEYRNIMEEAGFVFSGTSPEGDLMEIVELKDEDHPWFVGVQFHAEFKSRPTRPHPLFKGFVSAALNQ